MQTSKSFPLVQGFYCMLNFGLLVHIKHRAQGPVASLSTKSLDQKSVLLYVFGFRCLLIRNFY